MTNLRVKSPSDEAAEKTDSPEIKGLQWKLDRDKLYIRGSGAMADFSIDMHPPWYGHAIREVEIMEGVTSIGDYAFQVWSENNFAMKSGLEKVTLPRSLRRIGNYAFFYSCLESVELPSGLVEIGESAFAYSTLKGELGLPNTLERIGFNAFDSCGNLTSAEVPESVKEIGKYAFSGCRKLHVTVNGNCTVGNNAFDGVESVEYVTGWNSF